MNVVNRPAISVMSTSAEVFGIERPIKRKTIVREVSAVLTVSFIILVVEVDIGFEFFL